MRRENGSKPVTRGPRTFPLTANREEGMAAPGLKETAVASASRHRMVRSGPIGSTVRPVSRRRLGGLLCLGIQNEFVNHEIANQGRQTAGVLHEAGEHYIGIEAAASDQLGGGGAMVRHRVGRLVDPMVGKSSLRVPFERALSACDVVAQLHSDELTPVFWRSTIFVFDVPHEKIEIIALVPTALTSIRGLPGDPDLAKHGEAISFKVRNGPIRSEVEHAVSVWAARRPCVSYLSAAVQAS